MHVRRPSSLALALLTLAVAACAKAPPVAHDREEAARSILDAFAASDWETLATFVGPQGMRFTPHTHVDPARDRALSAAAIRTLTSDTTQRDWGIEEGSGFPIVKTASAYVARYVWDQDYRTAPEVRWDTVQEYGSVIDNARDIYPTASIVEYHFPSFNPEYGGMDWKSLRLVLEQTQEGTWQLVGVIHDEWAP